MHPASQIPEIDFRNSEIVAGALFLVWAACVVLICVALS